MQNNDIDAAIDVLDILLKDIHTANKIKHPRVLCQKLTTMEDANKAFDEYMRVLDDPMSTDAVLHEKLERYMAARKAAM